MGIAGRTGEYCQQWLQDRAAGAGAASSGAGGAAAAAVPPLHAVMTDSYGEWNRVPSDEALYLLLTIDRYKRSFRLPDVRIGRKFCAVADTAVCAITRLIF
jgi:hypothetical protein